MKDLYSDAPAKKAIPQGLLARRLPLAGYHLLVFGGDGVDDAGGQKNVDERAMSTHRFCRCYCNGGDGLP